MNEAMQRLQSLLSGANSPAQLFASNSRYAATPLATWTDPAGVPVTYLRRRFVPPPETFSTVAAHLVVRGDRVDLLAAAYLGDPEAYWRLCDANGVMRPEDLTDTVGRRIRIAIESGLPGSGDDEGT